MTERRVPLVLCFALASATAGVALVLLGCTGPNEPAPPPAAWTLPNQPQRPEGLPTARVVKVVDGDTVDVALGNRTERIRLIGIDTPELFDSRRPVQCFGKEAAAKARELLDGKTVWLEPDPSQSIRDRYDRLLHYIWLPDGRLFNLVMVVEGYAHEYTYGLPYKYQREFRVAQRHARDQELGLWSPRTCAADARQSAAATPAQPDAAAPDWPAQALSIIREPGTVRRGDTAAVAARGPPGVQCSISVRYRTGPSTARGLAPKPIDSAGNVSWSWVIGSTTTPGRWPVAITCGPHTMETAVTVE